MPELRDFQTLYLGKSARPNPFGLYDMYGSSNEWCFDKYRPYRAEFSVDPFEQPRGSQLNAEAASSQVVDVILAIYTALSGFLSERTKTIFVTPALVDSYCRSIPSRDRAL